MLRKTIGLLATATLAAVGGGSTASAQGFVTQFRVEAEQYAALPPSRPSAVGTPRVYSGNAIVLSMPVGWADAATASAPVTVRIANADWTIPAGEALVRATKATGGDLDTLRPDAIIYCSVQTEAKALLRDHIASTGSSTVLGDFAAWVRICAVDSNADGRFDKGFVAGAWYPAYIKTVPVAEAAYVQIKGMPIPGASLDILYFAPRLYGPPMLALDFLPPSGIRQPGFFRFPDNLAPPGAKESYAAEKEREAKTPPMMNVILPVPRTLPRTFTIGNAQLTVLSTDREAKTTVISVDRDPTFFRFTFHLDINGAYVIK